MKRTIFYTLFLLLFLTTACSNDDDNNMPAGPITVNPSFTINVEAILMRLPGSDITDLVDFGQAAGTSAADFESQVSVGDRFELDTPQGLQAGDLVRYSFIEFIDDQTEEQIILDGNVLGGFLERVLPTGVTGQTVDNYYSLLEDTGLPALAWEVIDADENDDVVWKYGFEILIDRGGQVFGPFFVDPKIRVRRLN